MGRRGRQEEVTLMEGALCLALGILGAVLLAAAVALAGDSD